MSRPYGVLIDRLGQGVRFEGKDFGGGAFDLDTVAIVLQGGGSDSWLLSIWADTGRGDSLLGRIRTLPWGQGERTVAICAHPGARAWYINGHRVAPVANWLGSEPLAVGDPPELSANNRLGVNMCSTPRVGGPWGITPIRGFAERAADSLYRTGVAGMFTLRGNIIGWTAWNNNVADGSVVIDAGQPILVPASGGFVQGGQILYKGYANFFNFVGTSSYRVDYENENPFEGAGEAP